jgi:hypothetical protein
MNYKHLVALLALQCLPMPALVIAAEPAEKYRTWTDTTGKFKVEAAFMKLENDKVELKRKDNGKSLTLALDKLSKADVTLAKKLASEASKPKKTESKESSDAKPTEAKKAWSGEWNNRKFGTKGPVTCIAEMQDGGKWKASFEGVGIGKPFRYEVEITATEKGNQTMLQGKSLVDGDSYEWSGHVKGNTLYGRYRSASGNNGEFQLKETKVPETTGNSR